MSSSLGATGSEILGLALKSAEITFVRKLLAQMRRTMGSGGYPRHWRTLTLVIWMIRPITALIARRFKPSRLYPEIFRPRSGTHDNHHQGVAMCCVRTRTPLALAQTAAIHPPHTASAQQANSIRGARPDLAPLGAVSGRSPCRRCSWPDVPPRLRGGEEGCNRQRAFRQGMQMRRGQQWDGESNACAFPRFSIV